MPVLLSASDHPRVAVHLEHQRTALHLILLNQLLLLAFRVHIHASEFIELKLPAVLPDPNLLKKDGAGRGDVNSRTDKKEQESRDQASDQPSGDIHHPLVETLLRGDHADTRGQNGFSPHQLHLLDTFLDILNFGQGHVHGDAH